MGAPLDGILIVDFSQFLAGPYASLRPLDMGARVIKVENPAGGDLCRRHYLTDTEIDEDSTLFHAINRGKESIALNLKAPDDFEKARRLIAHADVVIQNFRPKILARLGLGYDAVKALKPDIIYGSVSGYGETGAWSEAPGQDLLAQARSGIMWLSGNAEDGPVPLGIPIADITAGGNLAQGLLGALFRRATSGKGALVETSLLKALVDLQFAVSHNLLHQWRKTSGRLAKGSAHGYAVPAECHARHWHGVHGAQRNLQSPERPLSDAKRCGMGGPACSQGHLVHQGSWLVRAAGLGCVRQA